MDGQLAVLAVVEKGSFEAAGKYLGIGRSAARKRVHGVESEIGTPLTKQISSSRRAKRELKQCPLTSTSLTTLLSMYMFAYTAEAHFAEKNLKIGHIPQEYTCARNVVWKAR